MLRRWSFSLVLLVAYLAIFHAWMHLSRAGVVGSGLVASAVLSALLWRALRTGYFLNRWDGFWHATVILDIAVEAVVIKVHDHLGFYLCALAFVIVVGGYRRMLFRRTAEDATTVPDPVTKAGVGCAGVSELMSARMKPELWEAEFEAVYRRGLEAWKSGGRSPKTMFSATDVDFLKGIGCTSQELFDFVDDALVYGEPDFPTVLAVQRIRRDHFLGVLGGKPAGRIVPMSALPAKTDAVDGIAWLPRLIVKARLKLRGEMPDDLMYGCGGDRPFLRRMKMTLPGFLELVRDGGDDDRRIIDTVKATAGIR